MSNEFVEKMATTMNEMDANSKSQCVDIVTDEMSTGLNGLCYDRVYVSGSRKVLR